VSAGKPSIVRPWHAGGGGTVLVVGRACGAAEVHYAPPLGFGGTPAGALIRQLDSGMVGRCRLTL